MRNPVRHPLRFGHGKREAATVEKLTLRNRAPGPVVDGGPQAQPGVSKGGSMETLINGGQLYSRSTAELRHRRRGLRATQLVAASLAVVCASLGVSAVPAQASTLPNISVGPDQVVGEAAAGVIEPITLSASPTTAVTVDYGTANGTATGQGSCINDNTAEYVPTSGILTFAANTKVLTKDVTVPLLNCGLSLPFGFGTFYLNLSSNSAGSDIVRATTQVDVTGDAPATATPGLSVRDAAVDASAGSVDVPVILGGPSGAAAGVAVSVTYTVKSGSALAGTDFTVPYSGSNGTLTFAPGQTAQNISIPILDRSGAAATRSFSVTLGTPTNATIADGTGVVTIGASGSAPASPVDISAPPDVVVGEADGYVDLPVTLSAPAIDTVTVDYGTANGTATGQGSCINDNTAEYEPSGNASGSSSDVLTFLPGVTTQVVRVPLLNCGVTVKQTFFLDLSGNSSGSNITDASTMITIVSKITAPGAPRGVAAVAGIGSATVSFAAPASDGGDPINLYTVSSKPGGTTASGVGSPITIDGLTNGTSYTFTVTATSPAGTGAASPASNSVTPGTVPGAPSDLVGTAGKGSIKLTWKAPSSTGDSPITNYIIKPSAGSPVTVGNVTSDTVTGLTNGTAYTFTVAAANSVGTGSASARSKAVTPDGLYIVTKTLPKATDGKKYTGADLQEKNGVGTEKWTATGLPGGLTLGSAGVLSGTVSSGVKAKTYSVSVTVTDSSKPTKQTATTKLSLVVAS
jgi:large repetitive protein